jgi:hypothetical protein
MSIEHPGQWPSRTRHQSCLAPVRFPGHKLPSIEAKMPKVMIVNETVIVKKIMTHAE